MTATIRSILHGKGFGFISSGNTKDYFFHISDCKTLFKELKEGDLVEFELVDTPKGKRAVDVKLAGN